MTEQNALLGPNLDNPAGVTSCFRVPLNAMLKLERLTLAKTSAVFFCSCRLQRRREFQHRINAEMGSVRLAPRALFVNDVLTRAAA